ncbi:MAG: DUF2027 domain-containing protein [Muribaculaceae bacterium]|nr:DUF2027 domain-containing protein [Muribaculaceae bacterium]MDE6346137.1 DUF2027 domain-containing protein [Muribaculaceae bacterium]
MAKVGDTVRFLNSVGGGRIVRIDGNIAHVEDADGFEVPALLRECVVVMEASAAAAPAPATATTPKEKANKEKTKEPELPRVETPDGDKINVVMAFEATDLKSLSNSEFDVVLVNDSNYFLNFTFATRAEDENKWTLRRAGTVEPNIVLTMCTLASSELNTIDRAMIQIISYKDDKSYECKAPVSVETKIDNTKFFKLHCFKSNPYFDTPVIAVDIIKDDKAAVAMSINAAELQNAIREKRDNVTSAQRKAAKSRRASKNDILEVDLHITELLDNTSGLSRADMLNRQIDEFRRVMDENLRNHGRKIVFIHGKGEGVLRQALLKELTHRYKGHDVSDASFREYGFGATQVVIR